MTLPDNSQAPIPAARDFGAETAPGWALSLGIGGTAVVVAFALFGYVVCPWSPFLWLTTAVAFALPISHAAGTAWAKLGGKPRSALWVFGSSLTVLLAGSGLGYGGMRLLVRLFPELLASHGI